MLQNFNTTNHDKWWIPIKLVLYALSESIERMVTLSQEPSLITREIEIFLDHFAILDIQQAGKYISRNYLYTFM